MNRRFLNATGLSPRQYLRRVRIETAKRLLEGRNAPVDRIAEQVGYGDTRAFIRAFGVLAGLSPGQYRDRFRARSGFNLLNFATHAIDGRIGKLNGRDCHRDEA